MKNPYTSLANFVKPTYKSPALSDYMVASMILLMAITGVSALAGALVSLWLADPIISSLVYATIVGVFAVGYVSWRLNR